MKSKPNERRPMANSKRRSEVTGMTQTDHLVGESPTLEKEFDQEGDADTSGSDQRPETPKYLRSRKVIMKRPLPKKSVAETVSKFEGPKFERKIIPLADRDEITKA